MPACRSSGWGRSFLVLCVLALGGCADTAETILRTAVNLKNELTDRLTKVNSEVSAEKFVEGYIANYRDRLKLVDEKWQKCVKDVEDDYRSKKLRMLPAEAKHAFGSEEWRREVDKLSNVDDPRVGYVRDQFMAYMKQIAFDDSRLKREKDRIKGILAKLGPGQYPNLVKLTDAKTYENMLVTGANKIN